MERDVKVFLSFDIRKMNYMSLVMPKNFAFYEPPPRARGFHKLACILIKWHEFTSWEVHSCVWVGCHTRPRARQKAFLACMNLGVSFLLQGGKQRGRGKDVDYPVLH